MEKPYYQDDYVTIYHGDCREILPRLEAGSVDLVLTDPPYGVGKAKWDGAIPDGWLDALPRLTPIVGIMPGLTNLFAYPKTIGRLQYIMEQTIIRGIGHG